MAGGGDDLARNGWRRDSVESEGKSGAVTAAFALRDQRSAVRMSERLGNRQAEAESPETALERLLALFEGIEDAIDNFLLHSDSVIAHGYAKAGRQRIA